MDPFSVASSVFSIICLAIQLGKSISRAYKFLDLIKDAPNTVQSLMNDLIHLNGLLDEVLSFIKRQESHANVPRVSPSLLTAIRSCEMSVQGPKQMLP